MARGVSIFLGSEHFSRSVSDHCDLDMIMDYRHSFFMLCPVQNKHRILRGEGIRQMERCRKYERDREDNEEDGEEDGEEDDEEQKKEGHEMGRMRNRHVSALDEERLIFFIKCTLSVLGRWMDGRRVSIICISFSHCSSPKKKKSMSRLDCS